jgi:hypothetical protein
MRRRRIDETPKARREYEESYGDAESGGWAPRTRSEDFAERSRYSSQRDRQEDRSGFTRGFQGEQEAAERHGWSARHARSDEAGWEEDTEAGAEPASGPVRTVGRPPPRGVGARTSASRASRPRRKAVKSTARKKRAPRKAVKSPARKKRAPRKAAGVANRHPRAKRGRKTRTGSGRKRGTGIRGKSRAR